MKHYALKQLVLLDVRKESIGEDESQVETDEREEPQHWSCFSIRQECRHSNLYSLYHLLHSFHFFHLTLHICGRTFLSGHSLFN